MKLSESEIESLIEEYSGTIRQICRKFYLVGGTDEDLFQEGMIGFLQGLKNYNDPEGYKTDKFKNFAKLCVKRQIYDAIKHANKKNNAALNTYLPLNKITLDDEEYEREEMADLISPEDIVLDKEDHDEKIKLCQKLLSKQENEVLKLYLLGEKQSEIAKQLGKSVKSIDNTIQRIKNKLK